MSGSRYSRPGFWQPLFDIRPANYQGETTPRSPEEKQLYIEALGKMATLWEEENAKS